MGFHVWLPFIRRGPQIGRYMVNLPFEDGDRHSRPDFKCLYGDQWFTGNRKVAKFSSGLPRNICGFVGIFVIDMSPMNATTKRYWVSSSKDIKSDKTIY